METSIKNWTRDEFKAYVLLYAAFCDQIENRQEKNYILSKIDRKVYEDIHYELKADNDYQSIQKIIAGIEKFNYSEEDLQRLSAEIMELFLADEKFDTVEQCVYMMLKKILHKN